MRSSDGQVSELEVITATNGSLAGAAMDFVSKDAASFTAADVEPGATPQSSEVFYTVLYLNLGTSR
jgi:hypothetical protein